MPAINRLFIRIVELAMVIREETGITMGKGTHFIGHPMFARNAYSGCSSTTALHNPYRGLT